MSRSTLAATLVASASAILYSDEPGMEQLIRADNIDHLMVFQWPEEGIRCGATMISDRMALTSAHCIY